MTDQQAKGFDLGGGKNVADLEDQGIVVELFDELSEPVWFSNEKGERERASVTVAGSYSSRYRRAQEAVQTRTLKRRGQLLTGELLTMQRLEVVAACVLSWRGFFDGGKPLPCERAEALRVLSALPWVREQVEAAMEDHAAFFRRN